MTPTFVFTPRAQQQWNSLAAAQQEAARRLLVAVQLSPQVGVVVDRTPEHRPIRRVSGPRIHVFYVWTRVQGRIAVIDILDIEWQPADPDSTDAPR
jgi:hypothetical protein